ncbi:pollen receptor-like kinase 3 [Cicer arietinum]|uniref:Pollen receptor-like kinase 3 n=1 Tax=Cicer arietinum TaxID=3827 RepID=A0A3Q7Y379_CICAR|nr:pollen receptor-like kinase 3 [Cicer arietinum]
MAAIFHSYLFILIFIINFSMICSISESEALLSLKNSLSNADALDNWIASTLPCSEDDQWEGVVCYNGFVTGLRLVGMGLLGKIDVDALLELKALRTISFVNNSFSGSIPELNRIGFLKAMYLSGNNFSGHIPKEYFMRMKSLKKVWLSNNQFTGDIPSSLSEVPNLIELHLENNQFSGNIPNLNNPALVKLNVSNNKLEGEVPESLLRFNESSFAGNSGLCGEKFGSTCGKPMMQTNPITDDHNVSQLNTNIQGNVYVTDKTEKKSKALQILGIVVTSLVLISLAIFLIIKSRKNKKEKDDSFGEKHGQEISNNNDGGFEVQVSSSNSISSNSSSSSGKRDAALIKKTPSSRRSSSNGGGKGIGELVMMNEEKGVFGLSDLMKASAEVLGNGGFGSSYKVVMANGVAVVVKRSRELNKLGRLKHWNILTPLAYHYRKDEKLVISEYVPRGSLLFLLHGDRGASHSELDWQTRLKIVQGIAKGMKYLHTELSSSDLPHGNLKSSNVLLGPDYEPLLIDYGFIHMVNPSSFSHTLFAYKVPEASQHNQISPRCDVYCFGVIILEILTGKFPSQYLINGKGGTDVVQWVASAICEGREVELLDPEISSDRNSLSEMEKLIHIGAACTESNVSMRLDMMEAVRRIEEIKINGNSNNINNNVQESRTIEVLPSLRDGYADSQEQHHGDESRRRHGTNSFGSKEYFEFGIS